MHEITELVAWRRPLTRNVRNYILAHGYCAAIVSIAFLLLDVEQDEDYAKPCYSNKKLNELNDFSAPFCKFLMFWSNSHWGHLLDRGQLHKLNVGRNSSKSTNVSS